jgi:long-chain acyl-CoA synthetase
MLLHETLEQTAERTPARCALVAEGVRYSYAQVNALADGMAAQLAGHGVRRGDRVATFLDNRLDAVVAIYAALKCGAVFMPINPLTKSDKLAYLLKDSEARVLVTQETLRSVYAPVLEGASALQCCLVVETDGAAHRSANAASSRPAILPAIDVDLASIIYTSGSTGEPKGVMLTHLNMLSAARSVSEYLGLRESDVIFCALPLAFDYGLYQVLMGFLVGATVVLERSFAFPVRMLERMALERVSVFPGVPTMFSLLTGLKTLSAYDLASLRLITNTAAALPETHIREMRRLFPQAQLYSMYGLTECKRVTFLPPEQLDARPTSVGRGMPNEEVWLVDEAGQRLPNGNTGELVVRGSHVMRGYWRKPEATARRLKPGPLPNEMVLYSGDIFRTDEEGYLYFVARKDDIIKSRGEKVSPREVENVLYAMPSVQEAAVIGVDDELLGQAVKAFVVLRDGHAASEREIIKHCAARLESFMAPKFVTIVPSLPRTATGKISKSGLR